MKTKKLYLAIASLLSLLVLTSLVSAAITFTSVPTDISQSSGSFNVVVNSAEARSISFSASQIIEGGKKITFNGPQNEVFTAGQSKTIPISYTVESGFDFKFGNSYQTTLTAAGDDSVSKTATISFQTDSDFCSTGKDNLGDLDVTINLNNLVGENDYFGDNNNDDLYPLNQIEVEVDVENNGNDDVKNIEIDWALYTKDGNKIDDDNIDEIDLRSDDKETLTFVLNFDPSDLDVDISDYVLYVKATGEIEEGTDKGQDTCFSESEDLTVNIEDFVVVDAESLNIPETAQCNAPVSISGDIWNIGDSDQDDVLLRILSPQLNLEQEFEFSSINSFDNEQFNLDFDIPKNTKDGTYGIEFRVYEDNGKRIYKNDLDDESKFTVPLKVQCGGTGTGTGTGTGGVISNGNTISVSAQLQSGGQEGEDISVLATVINSGTTQSSISLSADNYQSWADSATLSQTSFVLTPGESKQVTITLAVKDDASGQNSFNIKLIPQGQTLITQPVQVTIEDSGIGSNFNFGGIITKDNWYLWAIGLINIILVIVIIIVAVRVARR
ncbi:MAG: putative S-layer protein [Nanoarchaeota archaeon]|nr:putative S-layer protein [Nanoarchaeota archaeon]